MITAKDIYDILKIFAPLNLKMDFDNPGFLVGRTNKYVSKVIIALDITADVIEEAKEKQKYMDYAKRNSKYEERYNNLKKEEKELEELINTMVIDKKEDTDDELDMLNLKGDENTIVTNPISTDIEDPSKIELVKEVPSKSSKVDKTFYTDSNMFTKNDFEDFTGLSRTLNGSSKGKKIFIILLILIILGVAGYLIAVNFIIK